MCTGGFFEISPTERRVPKTQMTRVALTRANFPNPSCAARRKGSPASRCREGFLSGEYHRARRLSCLFFVASRGREPGSRDFAHALEEELEKANDHGTIASVEAGVYELIELLVLAPVQTTDVEEGVRRFGLLASARPPHHVRDLHVASKPPTKVSQKAESRFRLAVSEHRTGFDGPYSKSTIELPRDFWVGDKHHFEVKPEQANEWTITLPDALVEAVRTFAQSPESRNAQATAQGRGRQRGNG